MDPADDNFIDLSIDDEDTYVIKDDSDEDDIGEWDAQVRKNFSQISGYLENDHYFIKFIKTYLMDVEYMCGYFETSEDLRRKVQNHVEFLHSSFLQIKCHSEGKYLEVMEEILAIYMKLELNVIRKMVRSKKAEIQFKAQRIIRLLLVILLNHNSHVLHVLIKQSDNYNGSKSCSVVLNEIYRHYLLNKLPLDKTDEEFCRRYIVFQKWKNFVPSSRWVDMDRVMYKQHNRRPESIESNDVLRPILMPSGESTVDVVRLCYDGLNQIANRYFEYLSSKKEQTCDTDFDVDLSNFMLQDDEVTDISDHNSEDIELSKACENFLKDLSRAEKAITNADYDKNQRCKEESLEVEEEEEEEISTALLLDKDVFSLGDMNVSLPNVSVEKEIATVSEKTHLEPTVSDETHPSLPNVVSVEKEIATVSGTHQESTVSVETHLEPIVFEETHPERTLSAEIRIKSGDTHSEPAPSEDTHSEPTPSEDIHSERTASEEIHPEVTVSEETYSEPIVSEEIHLGTFVSKDANLETTVDVASVEEVTDVPVVSSKDPVPVEIEERVTADTTASHESGRSLDDTNNEVVDMELCSELAYPDPSVNVASVKEVTKISVVTLEDSAPAETQEKLVANTTASYESGRPLDNTDSDAMDMELCSVLVPVEEHQSPNDADLGCPELTPEVSVSATCSKLIPEVVSRNNNLKAPTLSSSVKKYSYNYGQITPPSDVSSDDHNGDKVVVYPKPVQLPCRPESCASQVNGVHHRPETATRECITTLPKHIPAKVLPPRVSPVQRHPVINSVNKREQDPRTKTKRGRGTSGYISPAAAKVDSGSLIDNLNVELNKTIDTGQTRVVPVSKMQSISAVCNSSIKIKENTYLLEGLTRFEQLHNEVMNGPVSKATPVKTALTADENSDFERDIFSSKVTLVQRPLQAPPPISGDESSRSNSPSDSPSPAYEVIEKDDCKDHFAHSYKDANGANGSKALVPRVNRPRTPKSILKKDESAASRKKKRTDHIKFNDCAKISYFNADPIEDNNHTKYLQQILRKEAVVLPGDMRPSMMEDPKLNEYPNVVVTKQYTEAINKYTKSDEFLKRRGVITQPNTSGSEKVRVDYDKSGGSVKLNEKDRLYKSSTPAIDIEKALGFRLIKPGCVMIYTRSKEYEGKKPRKRKTGLPDHVTGDSVPTEKKKRVCRTPEEKLEDTLRPIQKRKGRRPKTPRKFSQTSPDHDDKNDFDKLLNSGAYFHKPFRVELA